MVTIFGDHILDIMWHVTTTLVEYVTSEVYSTNIVVIHQIYPHVVTRHGHQIISKS